MRMTMKPRPSEGSSGLSGSHSAGLWAPWVLRGWLYSWVTPLIPPLWSLLLCFFSSVQGTKYSHTYIHTFLLAGTPLPWAQRPGEKRKGKEQFPGSGVSEGKRSQKQALHHGWAFYHPGPAADAVPGSGSSGEWGWWYMCFATAAGWFRCFWEWQKNTQSTGKRVR